MAQVWEVQQSLVDSLSAAAMILVKAGLDSSASAKDARPHCAARIALSKAVSLPFPSNVLSQVLLGTRDPPEESGMEASQPAELAISFSSDAHRPLSLHQYSLGPSEAPPCPSEVCSKEEACSASKRTCF